MIASLDGAVEGQIVLKERGSAGFGYDTLFQPKGFEQTFAELTAAQKNALSHRALAVAKLQKFLREVNSTP